MSIKLKGSSDGSVSFDAPADTSPSGSDITLVLPTTVGSAEQFLKNSGTAGTLEFSSMVETSTGVGIGTSSPAQQSGTGLHIHNASGQARLKITNNTVGVTANDGTDFIAEENTNFHILNHENGALKLGTNDAERMRIDSSGKVGIGTTSPDGSLHVHSGSAGSVTANGNANNLVVENSDTGGISILTPDNGFGYIMWGSPTSNEGAILRYRDSDNIFSIGTEDSAGQLQLRTGAGTEAVRIDSSGNVGIGTSSPSFELHVSQSGAASEIAATSNVTSGTASRLLLGNSVGTARATFNLTGGGSETAYLGTEGNFALYFQTHGAERMRIDGSGRVLVGSSSLISPNIGGIGYANRMQIVGGATGDGLTVSNTADFARINLIRNANVASGSELGAISFGSESGQHPLERAQISCVSETSGGSGGRGGYLRFAVSEDGSYEPTERLRITRNGRLDVFAKSNTDAHFISSQAGAGTAIEFIKCLHSASSTGSGTASFKVSTNGNVQNTNNSYGSISDVKLKENIADASSQWDDIKGLRVRNYNFKEETGNPTHTQIGVVAQEVETVSPGLVYETPDRDSEGTDLGTVTKSVNYSVLYMKAVKALQEAIDRIETLETKVAALEAQ